MSLVIAIKDKDRIVLGADKQSSVLGNKDHTCTKIWEVGDLPGAVIGSVGSMRCSQIIQYNNIIDMNDVANEGVTTRFIVNSLVPVIVGVLKSNSICCQVSPDDDKEHASTVIPNAFLFAFEDKAWMIWNDLSVSEVDEYLAIGSGSDVANGALFATKGKNPFERIVTAIDAAAETTLYVDNGVDILATDYYEKDAELVDKALGVYHEEPSKTEKKKSTTKKKTEQKSKK